MLGCSGERADVVWIYALPAWLFMPLATVGACGISAGLLAIWRTRLSRNEEIRHNDVAGPILNTIGTILAVMMSFMVVGVWQEYDQAAQTAQLEASAASDLHHVADAFPKPFRDEVHSSVDRYISLVITDEWPLMKRGYESQAAHDEGYRLQSMLAQYRAPDPTQQLIQQQAMGYAATMLDERRDRIMSNRQGIPFILWATMLFCGFVTVAFSFYFRVDRPRAQYVMVVALTAVIALTFTLIAELDFPFRGDMAIAPSAFVRILDALHAPVGSLPL